MGFTQQLLAVFYSFAALFVGLWLLAGCLLSLVGGWHALAKLYRSDAENSGKRFPGATMVVGPGVVTLNYRSCMVIRVDPAGLFLSVFLPFRFFHPPLLIPWNAVSDCRRERFWLMRCTRIELIEPELQLGFLSKAGDEIYRVWQQHRDPAAEKTPALADARE
jgi:hypothetical protein